MGQEGHTEEDGREPGLGGRRIWTQERGRSDRGRAVSGPSGEGADREPQDHRGGRGAQEHRLRVRGRRIRTGSVYGLGDRERAAQARFHGPHQERLHQGVQGNPSAEPGEPGLGRGVRGDPGCGRYAIRRRFRRGQGGRPDRWDELCGHLRPDQQARAAGDHRLRGEEDHCDGDPERRDRERGDHRMEGRRAQGR